MRSLTALVVTLVLSASLHAGTVPPIWEPNFGPNVLTADDGTTVVNFGFAFPFLGQTYTSGSLSSNGFLWLNPANTDAACCNGDPAAFLAGDPRIAGGWFDLSNDPSNGAGNINFNTFSGRAVITFDQVTECCSATNTPYSFQMQLFSTGEIILAYNGFTSPAASHNQLIGVTAGNGDTDPGSSDFLNGPINISSAGSVYQLIPGLTLGDPPFSGNDIIFLPQDTGGWNITTDAAAAPEPATFALMGLGIAAILALARHPILSRAR